MTHMSEAEIANWIALYTATGLCCGIAMVLSVLVLSARLLREKIWRDFHSTKDVVLFVPRVWWRWQKLYLFSTPVTLGVVGFFGLTLSWP